MLFKAKPKGIKFVKALGPRVFSVAPRPFRMLVPPRRVFRLKQVYEHNTFMRLDALHDEEVYSFHDYVASKGYIVRQLEGFRLKSSWGDYPNAWEQRTTQEWLRTSFQSLHSNWVEVRLPNGFAISVQPRSKTPAYFD